MNESTCIFCKIAKKEQSADIVSESDRTISFLDINPKAPVHILIIPKKHIESVNDITDSEKEFCGELLLEAKKIAHKQGIDEGYKLMFNVGKKGGQVVDHLHLHLLGGF
jgi:histidine triad (HIT) family protein